MLRNRAWQFVKASFRIRTLESIQSRVLLALAMYCAEDGECFVTPRQLMRDTCCESRDTLESALTYLRENLKIIRWKEGIEIYSPACVLYCYLLDYEALTTLAKAQTRRLPTTGKRQAASVASANGQHGPRDAEVAPPTRTSRTGGFIWSRDQLRAQILALRQIRQAKISCSLARDAPACLRLREESISQSRNHGYP
jgi:hypothetical protein